MERSVLAFIFFCFLILFSGAVVSVIYCEFHIVSRSGALVVVVSLFLTLIQFWFEGEVPSFFQREKQRARQRYEDKGNFGGEAERKAQKFVETLRLKFEVGRYHILLASLSMAALGELTHGFGDIFIELVLGAIGNVVCGTKH